MRSINLLTGSGAVVRTFACKIGKVGVLTLNFASCYGDILYPIYTNYM